MLRIQGATEDCHDNVTEERFNIVPVVSSHSPIHYVYVPECHLACMLSVVQRLTVFYRDQQARQPDHRAVFISKDF